MSTTEELTAFRLRFNAHLNAKLQARINALKDEIRAVQESANNETKSSAGDKYETGRAMAQLELEKLQSRLSEVQQQLMELRLLASISLMPQVIRGVMVKTNTNLVYISISVGKVDFEGHQVWVVSANAPLGKALLGRRVGDQVLAQGSTYQLELIG